MIPTRSCEIWRFSFPSNIQFTELYFQYSSVLTVYQSLGNARVHTNPIQSFVRKNKVQTLFSFGSLSLPSKLMKLFADFKPFAVIRNVSKFPQFSEHRLRQSYFPIHLSYFLHLEDDQFIVVSRFVRLEFQELIIVRLRALAKHAFPHFLWLSHLKLARIVLYSIEDR